MPALVFFKLFEMFQVSTTTTQDYSSSISTDDAKAWLKVDHSDEDAIINALRDAALEQCERHTGRTLRTSTFTITAPRFSDLARLPIGALTSVTSLQYYKENDATLHTLAATEYAAELLGDVMHIRYRQTTPTVDPYRPDAVTLTAFGGTRADEIPDNLRTAALMLLGHWYENRSAVHIGSTVATLPMAVESLLAQSRLV